MIRPIAICGATATGKTSLAVEAAKRLGGEIVSCDSMQLYRGMDIGTAKPTESERAGVPHHLIDILDPFETYSCARYKIDAEAAISDIKSRGCVPVLCGGTGLYLDALMYDNKYSDEGEDDNGIRDELAAFAKENGAHALHDMLAEIDPDAAASIHENNVRRVARAIEIYQRTGRRKSEWDAESRDSARDDITVIGLRFGDRALHREAIERRCREMFSSGLADEARRLYDMGALDAGCAAAQAIGYKELLPYLRGEETEEAAVMRLYYATCRYAKRQATWFYKKDYIRWLDVDGVYLKNESADELISRALAIYNGGAD